MKILVDLDPRDVWHIQAKAEQLGITPGEVLRREREVFRDPTQYSIRVRARVLAGACDADIASELGRTPAAVATERRRQGLPANRRYRKGRTA